MSHDSKRADAPEQWLLNARSDLSLAKVIKVPPEIFDAVELNPYAVATRYPGSIEPVTQDEYIEAMRIAEAILKWAEYIIGGSDR